ncbi:MAG TPA: CoA transferase, partial [Candidatus Binataceae bacterium]|nr:CoA transferase [Candidatus Binataceae bacterium]
GNTIEAVAGVTGLVGYHDGGQPYTLSNALGDPSAGLNGLFAVLVGLREREDTGRGQHIELAQVEGVVPFIGESILEYEVTGAVPKPRGNRHPQHAPHGIYACGSGFVALACESDEEWRKLAGVVGLGALANDARFAAEAERKRNEDALDAELARALRALDDRGADETARMLIDAGLIAGQVNSAADILGDAQLSARGFYVPVDRAVVGTHLYPGVAQHFSASPLVADRPAPLLGEHNRRVFSEILGMSDAEIAALEREKIIGTSPFDRTPKAA